MNRIDSLDFLVPSGIVLEDSTVELIHDIRKKYSAAWQVNDAAHRDEHFLSVFKAALTINTRLDLGFDEKMMAFAAWFHDLFAWSRDNHHLLSYHFVLSTEDPLFDALENSQRTAVALACLQHRASFKGEFSCLFAQLINAADRGVGSALSQYNRAMQYTRANYPELDTVQQAKRAIEHIKQKYGTGGYARYPNLYTRAFPGELTQLREEIDAFTFSVGLIAS